MDRVILHCDLNNFYASVECMLNPELKGLPVAVGGSVEKRHGVILAKNELAKKKGVKTGETLREALNKEPNLVIVPPQHDLYMKYSKQVFDIYSRFTCYVEPFGPDECWLDVTGSRKLFGTGREIADTLREVVKKETGGLTISVGVSFNKVFAKMASDIKKPDATTEITRENFRDILWPLDTRDMLMVGAKTAEKLQKLNIHTVGDLAVADEKVLKTCFGVNGLKLKRNAAGLDDEPVREYVASREVKSVGHGMTSTRDLTTVEDASALIYYLADRIASRMRKNDFKGSGVALDLRDNSLKSFSRQCKINYATRSSNDIADAAIKLLKENWDGTPPLRTITVSVFDLIKGGQAQQIGMFDDEDKTAQKNDSLDLALDKIRSKYGSGAIMRGNLIERDFIYDKTDAEDFCHSSDSAVHANKYSATVCH